MNQVWDIGGILLELLCVAFMIFVFATAQTYIDKTNSITRINNQSAEYQAEYAQYSVYDSRYSGAIAYTEVLQCVYTYSSKVLPVTIHGTRFNDTQSDKLYRIFTGMVNRNLSYADLSDELRLNAGSRKYTGKIQTHDNGTMIGIEFTPVS